MFTTDHAFPGFSVDDIEAARRFYGDTLGMTVSDNDMGFLVLDFASGGRVLIYDKPNHEPASFTILNFPVRDLSAAVDDLNARGVNTKIYSDDEFPTDHRGIVHATDNGPDIAWFRDPAGNVLAVFQDDDLPG
ncbi:extradiol dioxygenase family protein [Microbacterium sp. SLBN-154]|uniref:VOC family protein n=1 Tax=Microbacterium sp. SLBN-154 TaxID=2768458 RepID=UPI00114F0A1B|nr:VOC family protein [Microbacterium sp. SLBN-154]TQK18209.1 extradiol dioxygenase family protein [Microbacterium sp. SLBN-154]